eukprot:CAMPEP_0206559554 /NCGR_PEP_ID=MMETSP0325_2-20121206/20465_1 /ASSEMBLY_ACC=CAM_ASM_000347 /TAXON_ID=2866 /ORGANISM="Crypthecodinium cohnii, Strain Seligo" /LENGTH=773 /DNA_ID=CAMNT_0054061081 /DNA_START=116 /DNA_END=2437 /DNA_ORIENTATION=+
MATAGILPSLSQQEEEHYAALFQQLGHGQNGLLDGATLLQILHNIDDPEAQDQRPVLLNSFQCFCMATAGILPSLSQQEEEHYAALFQQLGHGQNGLLDGATAAGFMTTSGLAQEQLRKIWEIADEDNIGSLDFPKFSAICRLMAHAQCGLPPSKDLLARPPQLLPEFEGFRRNRQPSETSSRAGSPSPLTRDFGSSNGRAGFGDLQPVIAGSSAEIQAAAAEAARRPPSPRPFTWSQWSPSQREKRKYATLFKRLDWDSDGFVQGEEVRNLLARSQLNTNLLADLWDMADRDGDHRLNFGEFLSLVHMVTCILRGAPPLDPRQGLPRELLQALDRLESPEVLVAQREESSRSRSVSPAPSGPVSRSTSPQLGAADYFGTGGSAPPPPFNTIPADAAAAAAEDELFGPLDGPSKSSKKEKKDKRSALGNDEGEFGSSLPSRPSRRGRSSERDRDRDQDRDRSRDRGESGRRSSAQTQEEEGLWASPSAVDAGSGGAALEGHGESFPGLDVGRSSQETRLSEEAEEDRLRRIAVATSHFDSFMCADREVTKQVAREVDELQDELRDANNVCNQVDDELRSEQRQEANLLQQMQDLERRVEETRTRLLKAKDARRGTNLENLALRRDRSHCEEELAFLQQLAEEEGLGLQSALQTNEMLRSAHHDVEVQIEGFEVQRRKLATQVNEERELVREGERKNAQLRSLLEQLHRDHVRYTAARREAMQQQLTRQEMQRLGRPQALAQGRVVDPPAGRSHGLFTGDALATSYTIGRALAQ